MSVRRVSARTVITWDGGDQPLDKGTFIQVEPASTLETAIGTGNLEAPADPAAAAVHAGVAN